MQTPAERQLVAYVASALRRETGNDLPLMLNVGAGQSLAIEEQLVDRGVGFRCDRVDVEDCNVRHPLIEQCLHCSATDLSPLASNHYRVALANFVLEHVEDIDRTAREVFRVLEPGGSFVATIPNPRAPEFLIAQHTPLAFHRWIRGGTGWETHYAYRNLKSLKRAFESAGFLTQAMVRFACVSQYTERFTMLHWLGRLYDAALAGLHLTPLMGNVCVAFQKPSDGAHEEFHCATSTAARC